MDCHIDCGEVKAVCLVVVCVNRCFCLIECLVPKCLISVYGVN